MADRKKGFIPREYRDAWHAKTLKLNGDHEIRRGDVVAMVNGYHGVVVEVRIPENPSVEDHGTVAIWLDNETNYGDNNCEHYPWLGWQKYLRIEHDA